jgi:hypothetical protein
MANPAPDVQPSPRFPKETLRYLIETLAQVQAAWSQDPREDSMRGAGLEEADVWLTLKAMRQIGTDELRTSVDPVSGSTSYLQLGQRTFTLSCRCRSLDPTLEAVDLAERIRFRLSGELAASIFRPANLSLIRTMDTISLFGQTAAEQQMKVAIMDIRWNWRPAADPMDANESTWIESVDGLSDASPNVPIPLMLGGWKG